MIYRVVLIYYTNSYSTQPAGDKRVEWNIASITELFVLYIAFHEELIKQPKVPIYMQRKFLLNYLEKL